MVNTETNLKKALDRLMGKKGSISPTKEKIEKSKKQGETLRKKKREIDPDVECLWTSQFNATPVVYTEEDGKIILESD